MNSARIAARERERRYRQRRRLGAELVPLGVTPAQRAGLERLGLVAPGESRHALAEAIGRLLDAAEPLAAVGGVLFPNDRV